MFGERVVRLYLDSNVILSLIFCEFGKGLEYMEEAVEQMINQNHEFIVSEFAMEEVNKKVKYSKQEIVELLKNKITFIESTAEDDYKAEELMLGTGLHFSDSLHIILAMNSKSDLIVTWDKEYNKTDEFIQHVDPRTFLSSNHAS